MTTGENQSPNVQYDYDNTARLESTTYPNGRVVEYTYGSGIDYALSRVAGIISGGLTYAQYSYLGVGTIVTVAHPGVTGGLTLSYGSAGSYPGLDQFGRVVEQTWTVNGSVVDRYGYTYDPAGNRKTRSNPLNPDFTECYGYDALNRLVGVTRGEGQGPNDYQEWTLDQAGNFAAVQTDTDGDGILDSEQTRTINAANEIQAVSGQANPTYDAAGNMTFDGTWHYRYDAWNRLVKVRADDEGEPGEVVATYEYDGRGCRVRKTVGETTADFYYNDNWQVLQEDVNGTAHVQYIWDIRYIDSPVCRLRDADEDPQTGPDGLEETLYYLTDGNFNVTALLDAATGGVVERYVYTPYGKTTFLDSAWDPTEVAGHEDGTASVYANEVLFAGYRHDPETGSYHVRARQYLPTLSVWLQRDPAGYADGASLHAYCRDNPITGLDPSGARILLLTNPDPDYPSDMEYKMLRQLLDSRGVTGYQVHVSERGFLFTGPLSGWPEAVPGEQIQGRNLAEMISSESTFEYKSLDALLRGYELRYPAQPSKPQTPAKPQAPPLAPPAESKLTPMALLLTTFGTDARQHLNVKAFLDSISRESAERLADALRPLADAWDHWAQLTPQHPQPYVGAAKNERGDIETRGLDAAVNWARIAWVYAANSAGTRAWGASLNAYLGNAVDNTELKPDIHGVALDPAFAWNGKVMDHSSNHGNPQKPSGFGPGAVGVYRLFSTLVHEAVHAIGGGYNPYTNRGGVNHPTNLEPRLPTQPWKTLEERMWTRFDVPRLQDFMTWTPVTMRNYLRDRLQ